MDVHTTMRKIRGTSIEEVLLVVADAGGESHLRPIEEAVGIDRRDVGEVAGYLRDLGLARRDQSLAGEVTLTHLGQQVAEAVERSRTTGQYRSDAVQGALLTWLEAANNPKSTDEFVGHADATAYDRPFTELEISEATVYLQSKALLRGVDSWGGTLFRPEVTPEGRAMLRSGEPVSEYLRTGGQASYYDQSNSTTFGGDNYGGVQTGPGNVQHVAVMAVTITQDQRSTVLDGVDALLRELRVSEVDGAKPVEETLQSVRAEAASSQATQHSLRDAIAVAIGTAAATKGTEFVTNGLADLLRHLTGTA